MSEWVRKRFWAEASPAETEGGWTVSLDGRNLRTPAKAALVVPTETLARMIAAEWQAQGERIDPLTMPATRMANSAIDKVAPQHAEVADLVAAYGGSDLLCYRAAAPVELAERQRRWDAPLDWAAARFGARLVATEGVMPIDQPPAALAALSAQVAALPAIELAPFHDLVAITGSLVLGLAVSHREMTAELAWELSRIDEEFQIAQWGEDAEAAEAASRKRAELSFAEAFLTAARDFTGKVSPKTSHP